MGATFLEDTEGSVTVKTYADRMDESKMDISLHPVKRL
jgi:hypothetical protein